MDEFDLAVKAAVVGKPLVQVWMNWMLIVFALSLVFIWKHKTARYVLLSLFISIGLAILVFNLTEKVYLVGIAHLIAWIPLSYYLIKIKKIPKSISLNKPYGIWITLILATIIISMIFDVRDIVLVFMGLR